MTQIFTALLEGHLFTYQTPTAEEASSEAKGGPHVTAAQAPSPRQGS